MGAKGNVARGLLDGHSDLGFEPLAGLVHQRDQRDRRLADLRREQGEIVIGILRGSIEHRVLAQRLEPLAVRLPGSGAFIGSRGRGVV